MTTTKASDAVADIPGDIVKAALKASSSVGFLPYEEREALVAHFAKAILAERQRIIAGLLEEAELTPCGEDAMVTRSNAFLIRANFSYEDAERLSVAEGS